MTCTGWFVWISGEQKAFFNPQMVSFVNDTNEDPGKRLKDRPWRQGAPTGTLKCCQR
jgi:hypothetical protein